MIASFVAHFAEAEDPRYEGFVRYPLPEIVLGALIGTLCGAEDWEEIALFCEEKLEVLRRFLPYENDNENGIASAKTFWRVFDLLDSQAFAACFAAWVDSLIGTVKGVVAIDGKTMRGARRKDGHEKALPVLSATPMRRAPLSGRVALMAKAMKSPPYRNFWKPWRSTEPLSRLRRWERKKPSRRPF